jgi:hypothetical protein
MFGVFFVSNLEMQNVGANMCGLVQSGFCINRLRLHRNYHCLAMVFALHNLFRHYIKYFSVRYLVTILGYGNYIALHDRVK